MPERHADPVTERVHAAADGLSRLLDEAGTRGPPAPRWPARTARQRGLRLEPLREHPDVLQLEQPPPMTDAVPGFEKTTFTYGGRTHDVYRAGSGPAVIVIHEMPGLHPGVTEFGQRLVDVGYTVYLPSLFGRAGGAVRAAARSPARSAASACRASSPCSAPVRRRSSRGCARWPTRRTPSVAAPASARSACASTAGSRSPWRSTRCCSRRSSASLRCRYRCRRRSARRCHSTRPICIRSRSGPVARRPVCTRPALHRGPERAVRAVRHAPPGTGRGVRRDRDRLVAGQPGRHQAVGTLGADRRPGGRARPSDPGRARPGTGVPGRAPDTSELAATAHADTRRHAEPVHVPVGGSRGQRRPEGGMPPM